MEQPIVKVVNLSHRYTTQWAIKDINFEIDCCGVVGLLGANGAGKSTTMNIICGVLSQTQGDVYIDGVNLKENPIIAKSNIGFLPQKPPLYPDLNVREYLTFCADFHMVEKKRIKGMVNRTMERCGLSHIQERVIRNLSGGYQQRVGIAQAIVHEPKFVVLDEPTNGLDPNQILEIRHLIKELAEERTVLLSTHILSEVQATCEQIKMIDSGRMVFSGSIDEFDNYIEPHSILVTFDSNLPEGDLLSVEGITRVEELHDRHYRLWFDGSPDITKRVMEKSMQNDWGLLEINFEKSSLDAIFAQLSNNRKSK